MPLLHMSPWKQIVSTPPYSIPLVTVCDVSSVKTEVTAAVDNPNNSKDILNVMILRCLL